MASASESDVIILTWGDADCDSGDCDQPDDWQVEYESKEGPRVSEYLGTSQSITVRSLLTGTTYTFYVRGLVGARVGAWVGVTVTTAGDAPTPVPLEANIDLPLPVGMPVNLMAFSLGTADPDTMLTVSWESPDDENCKCEIPTSWALEYEAPGLSRQVYATILRTQGMVHGLQPGTMYSFYVRGIKGSRVSPWAGAMGETAGTAPTTAPLEVNLDLLRAVGLPLNLSAMRVETASETDIQLTWVAPTDEDDPATTEVVEGCLCRVPDQWEVEYDVAGSGAVMRICSPRS